MKSLNEKERNNIFFQFLVFWVISMVMVIFITVSSIEVQVKDSEVVRIENEKLKKEIADSKSMVRGASSVEDIFTQVNSTQSKALNESKFQVQKGNLLRIVQAQPDSSISNAWIKIVTGYELRWNDKTVVVDQKESQSIIDKRDEKIEDLNKTITELTKQLKDCGNKQ